MQQSEEGSEVSLKRMQISQFLGFEEKQLNSLKLCPVIASAQVNVDESQSSHKQSIVAIDSDQLS